MWTPKDTPWDPTINFTTLPKKTKIQIFDEKKKKNPNPVIIWIKNRRYEFERHKEESLIISQVWWRTNRRSKTSRLFLIHQNIAAYNQIHTIYKHDWYKRNKNPKTIYSHLSPYKT